MKPYEEIQTDSFFDRDTFVLIFCAALFVVALLLP